MKIFLIKFLVSYIAMLGTFCVVFFGITTIPNCPIDEFGASILGCILSVVALFITNNIMLIYKYKL